jgi:hypothetical protein
MILIDLTDVEREERVLCAWCDRPALGARLAVLRTMDGEPVCSHCFGDSLRIERALRAVIREQEGCRK